MKIEIREAIPADVSVLREVIEASVRGLQAQDYTARQIELALKGVYGVDTRLIADRTYFAAEAAFGSAELETRTGGGEKGPGTARAEVSARKPNIIVACGGWSKRKTLFGGDQWGGRQDDLLDPLKDAAKIRAFFVRPEWARRGIGTMILAACETAAKAAGFRRLEMGATLSGVPFYAAKGYAALEDVEVSLGDGETLPIVRMAKAI